MHKVLSHFFEEKISTTATTAESIEQLEIEVETLERLERQALRVLRSGKDTKWLQLNKILDDDLMIDKDGNRYPAATPRELLQGYDMLDFDRNLGEIEGIVFNRFGALAGMLVGASTVIVWKQLEAGPFGLFDLYEIIPGFVLSAAAILLVSLITPPPAPRIRQQFDNLYG